MMPVRNLFRLLASKPNFERATEEIRRAADGVIEARKKLSDLQEKYTDLGAEEIGSIDAVEDYISGAKDLGVS